MMSRDILSIEVFQDKIKVECSLSDRVSDVLDSRDRELYAKTTMNGHDISVEGSVRDFYKINDPEDFNTWDSHYRGELTRVVMFIDGVCTVRESGREEVE